MTQPKKIEVNGKTYDLSDTDALNVREKATVPSLQEAFQCDIVNNFLKALRESDFFIRHIYTRGGCYQLYKILKTLWPEAQPYALGSWDGMSHVATKICGLLWDIDGEVMDGDGEFHLMEPKEMEMAEEWSFSANNDLYLGECPVCKEPIRIDRKKLINNKTTRL